MVMSEQAAKDLDTIAKTASWALDPLLASFSSLKTDMRRDMHPRNIRRSFDNTMSQIRACQRAIEFAGEQVEILWTVYYAGDEDA